MSDNFFEATTYKDKVFKGLMPEFYPPKYQQYIREEVELLKQAVKGSNRVLEAGVGIGRLISDLAPLVKEFVGIDESKFMIETSNKVAKGLRNVAIRGARIEDVSKIYPKDYFDISLCVWNTLGNVKDPVIVLKELAKVTKGSIFITVFYKGTISDRLDFYRHVDVEVISIDRENETYQLKGYTSKSFSEADIKSLAKKSGLRVVETQIPGGVMLGAELRK